MSRLWWLPRCDSRVESRGRRCVTHKAGNIYSLALYRKFSALTQFRLARGFARAQALLPPPLGPHRGPCTLGTGRGRGRLPPAGRGRGAVFSEQPRLAPRGASAYAAPSRGGRFTAGKVPPKKAALEPPWGAAPPAGRRSSGPAQPAQDRAAQARGVPDPAGLRLCAAGPFGPKSRHPAPCPPWIPGILKLEGSRTPAGLLKLHLGGLEWRLRLHCWRTPRDGGTSDSGATLSITLYFFHSKQAANSFCKGPDSKYFRLCQDYSTLLCSLKAAGDDTQTSGQGCVPVKRCFRALKPPDLLVAEGTCRIMFGLGPGSLCSEAPRRGRGQVRKKIGKGEGHKTDWR
ncbi:uncharacterized protein [Equus asinus]|uniref:uncharacterized protein n=1 Tax=Equus asinus TaxID=9793 RepID=UPI0038F653A0